MISKTWIKSILSNIRHKICMAKPYFAKSVIFIQDKLKLIYSKLENIIEKYKNSLEQDNSQQNEEGPEVNKLIIAGIMVLVFGLGGFISWAAIAELDSAAIAPGKIIVASKRKSIEHLEGGIVAQIHVKSGDYVKAEDKLISLDQAQTKARVDLTQAQLYELLALEARLKAELAGAKQIDFPIELQNIIKNASNNSKVQQIITSQKALFISRNKSFDGQISIYNQQIKQLDEEIDSLHSQAKSQETQLKLINEEIEAVKYLVEVKKVLERPRLLELQREAAKLTGNRDEKQALIAKAKQKIGETKLQIIQLKETTTNDNLSQLREAQAKITDTAEHNKAALDVHERTIIKAPQAGTIVNINVNTVGEVVNPGETIMEIVPSADELIIEARVDPIDIDVVHTGLFAKSTILAFKQRSVPSLEGEVTYVAADSVVDEATGEPYYLVKIRILPEEIKKLRGLSLYPGMTAQTMIITNKRTALDYFLSPIKESFDRAFREQ